MCQSVCSRLGSKNNNTISSLDIRDSKNKMLILRNIGLLALCVSAIFVFVKSDLRQSLDIEGRLATFIQSITSFVSGWWSKSRNILQIKTTQTGAITPAFVPDKISDDQTGNLQHEPLLASIESSMDENVEMPSFLDLGRQVTEPCGCVVQDADGFGLFFKCSTVCIALETKCGQTCTRTTSFYSFSYSDPSFAGGPKTIQTVNEKDCKKLSVQCLISSALSTASQSLSTVATASVGANVALGAGIAAGVVALALALTKPEEMVANNALHHDNDLTNGYDALASDYYPRNNEPKTWWEETNEENAMMDWRQTIDTANSFWNPSTVEGSFVSDEENRDVTSLLRFDRQVSTVCNCVFNLNSDQCSTTCLSFEQQQVCGVTQLCTLTTFVSSFEILESAGAPCATLRFDSINDDDCGILESACSVSSALLSVLSDVANSANSIATNAIVAAVLSAGLSGGNIAAIASSTNNQQANNINDQQQNNNEIQQNNENQPDNNNANNNQQQGGSFNQVPVNSLPFPVVGNDFPSDGCGDRDVRFSDGSCRPVLSRGPCNSSNFWVTIDPITLLGKCTPRLCTGDRRVYVGATGLCHDVNDPSQCQGGRRLYNTAYGDSICDCPIGQYPFPNSTQDDCVPLFARGPCPNQQVVSISQGGRLFCGPAECQSSVKGSGAIAGLVQQLVPIEKGDCFSLGSPGFCLNSSQVLGYNVLIRQPQCVNTTDSVPSRELPERSFYINQQHKIYPNVNHQRRFSRGAKRRQDDNGGIFQFPVSSEGAANSLLQPCRTGARLGINYKCANPLVPEPSAAGPTLPAVTPVFTCPMEGFFLQAGGQCIDDNRATSCGPSFQFNEATGQCRTRF